MEFFFSGIDVIFILSLDHHPLGLAATNKTLFVFRAIAPGILSGDLFQFQTLQHVMKMTRTWDSTMSMIPKGGDTIWGSLDWAPEGGYIPRKRKGTLNESQPLSENGNSKSGHQPRVNYGRIISFGRDAAELPSAEIERIEFRVSL